MLIEFNFGVDLGYGFKFRHNLGDQLGVRWVYVVFGFVVKIRFYLIFRYLLISNLFAVFEWVSF